MPSSVPLSISVTCLPMEHLLLQLLGVTDYWYIVALSSCDARQFGDPAGGLCRRDLAWRRGCGVVVPQRGDRACYSWNAAPPKTVRPSEWASVRSAGRPLLRVGSG